MRRLALFLAGFLIGCHGHRASFDPQKYEAVHRGRYVYQRINDGELVVAAVDGQALKDALAEIGCGKTYVCLVAKDGDLFSVEQRRK